MLPRDAVAHLTATLPGNLSPIGDLNTDRGQCEIVATEGESKQTVTSLRIDVDQAATIGRVNAAIQIAKERSARDPLPNPLRTGTDTAPSVSLAILCGSRQVQIGLDVTAYDSRRKAIDQDVGALASVVGTKYGERNKCTPKMAPPLPEEQRGTVRMLAGNGALELPGAAVPGPSASVGHIEAMTALDDGTVYFVARKYPFDINPRTVEDTAQPWGKTLRLVRIRADGFTEVAWDPNVAPFSTNDSPVAGDISEKQRLQGADTVGAIGTLVMNGDQAWLLPATASKPDGPSRPIRLVQMNGGRTVDLRVFKTQSDVDSTHVKDSAGRPLDPMAAFTAARFTALSFDGPTPVLMDSAHSQVWRLDTLRDGKIVDATVFPVATQLAAGSGPAGLSGGRFAASTPQGGLSIVDSRGKVVIEIRSVVADIDGVGQAPLELGRRQLAAAGDDLLVNAMSSQVSASAVVRVDTRNGAQRTLFVSGYPGPRDPGSDIDGARFANGYGTAANATRLFATGFPVAAMSAVGQDLLLSPFGTRILYQLTPRR